jgi:hypothetical protein
VIAIDPHTYKQWDDHLLNKPNEVLEDNENENLWKCADSAVAHDIIPRTQAEPPSVADIYIWLRTVRKLNGKTVFSGRGRWTKIAQRKLQSSRCLTTREVTGFKISLLTPKTVNPTWKMFGEDQDLALAGGNIDNKDPIAIARMSQALAEVSGFHFIVRLENHT